MFRTRNWTLPVVVQNSAAEAFTLSRIFITNMVEKRWARSLFSNQSKVAAVVVSSKSKSRADDFDNGRSAG